jgi:hypothetical protein
MGTIYGLAECRRNCRNSVRKCGKRQGKKIGIIIVMCSLDLASQYFITD